MIFFYITIHIFILKDSEINLPFSFLPVFSFALATYDWTQISQKHSCNIQEEVEYQLQWRKLKLWALLDKEMDIPINRVVEAIASYLHKAAGSAFFR